MSLLSVTVKKARYGPIQGNQFNTYVTLKLQNVKSTTVTVKGPAPSWEQDFLFEINDINLGLLVEVWNKGVIWDRALGYHYLPLASVAYEEQGCGGRWIELEAQLIMRGGAVVGTAGPTGHALLLDCRFEPPFDAEGTGGADLQRKLDLLNGALDAERAEQARRQMQYIAHSGYSEDSDYTSDLNYPVGQHPNCSASQFRNAAHQMHTPQRSLEVSRENSYEREEYHLHGDTDPLYYNSQPRTRIESWSQYQPELRAQASIESAVSWRTAADWQSGEDQRRPSLERQNTLYDDIGYGYDSYQMSTHIRDQRHISQQPSYEEYYDSTSYPYPCPYGAEEPTPWDTARYLYDDNFGMTPTEYENIVNKRRSSVVQLPQVPTGKQYNASSRYSDFNGMAPYRPRQRRTAASLPGTPSSTPKRGRALPVPPGGGGTAPSESGSTRSARRLPRVPRAVEAELDKKYPEISYGYDIYRYDATTDQNQDNNYSAGYDEDGMQPFFDETPHATPPAAQKSSWNETEPIPQFTYPAASEDVNSALTKVPSRTFHLPQPPVTSHQDQFQDLGYQEIDQQYDTQYKYDQQNEYGGTYQVDQQEYTYQHKIDDPYNQKPYQHDYPQQNLQNQQNQLNQQNLQDQQTFKNQQNLQNQQTFQSQQGFSNQQNLQNQQQKPTIQNQAAQQLQTSVMTGAATLGSIMSGGAKKLGSFLGAAAAAIAAPPISQTPLTVVTTSHTNTYIAPADLPVSIEQPLTPYPNTMSVNVASVPEVSPSVPMSETTPVTLPSLPRGPSLRRQESIQRPPVNRTRTLPDAPEDLGTYEEGVYEDGYEKTVYDQTDRTSLNQYHNDEYLEDTIRDETDNSKPYKDEVKSPPSLQKNASPTRNGSQIRKPSVDSYHSSGPAVIDRRTSQSSFLNEDKLAVPTTQEESLAEKSKVSFKEDRPTYHEVPETSEEYQDEAYDRNEDYPQDDTYPEGEDYREDDKFERDQFAEGEENYQEEEVFPDGQRPERKEFKEEKQKLSPKQRWHRAYNKIVMQLNVSHFTLYWQYKHYLLLW